MPIVFLEIIHHIRYKFTTHNNVTHIDILRELLPRVENNFILLIPSTADIANIFKMAKAYTLGRQQYYNYGSIKKLAPSIVPGKYLKTLGNF